MGIPLFLDIRYSLNPKPSGMTPFIAADGGIQFFPDAMDITNIFIQPNIGLQKRLSPKTSLKVSVGFLTAGMTPPGGRSSFFTIKGAISFTGKNGPKIGF
jgi:hypothetical protein